MLRLSARTEQYLASSDASELVASLRAEESILIDAIATAVDHPTVCRLQGQLLVVRNLLRPHADRQKVN